MTNNRTNRPTGDARCLVHDDKTYDSKAIAGAAHGFLPGQQPLAASEFSGGAATVGRLLTRLGFEVRSTGLTLEELLERVEKLRVGSMPSGGLALYQPITLLWAIGRARQGMGQVQAHWPRMRASSRVWILDELTPDGDRSDVVTAVARVLGTSVRLALSTSRDLGEAVVIGHAKVLTDAGHEVYVVVARHWRAARAYHLTVEDLTAVQLDRIIVTVGFPSSSTCLFSCHKSRGIASQGYR